MGRAIWSTDLWVMNATTIRPSQQAAQNVERILPVLNRRHPTCSLARLPGKDVVIDMTLVSALSHLVQCHGRRSLADRNRECERLFEIGESESSGDVVLVDSHSIRNSCPRSNLSVSISRRQERFLLRVQDFGYEWVRWTVAQDRLTGGVRTMLWAHLFLDLGKLLFFG